MAPGKNGSGKKTHFHIGRKQHSDSSTCTRYPGTKYSGTRYPPAGTGYSGSLWTEVFAGPGASRCINVLCRTRVPGVPGTRVPGGTRVPLCGRRCSRVHQGASMCCKFLFIMLCVQPRSRSNGQNKVIHTSCSCSARCQETPTGGLYPGYPGRYPGT
eukprot:1804002-Rhodomonas_salina.1